MSVYPSDQRCPRCQYRLTPGAQVCPNCGLALAGAAPSSNPLYPLPSTPPAGGSYGTLPASESVGTPPGGGYGAGNQPPTFYSPQGTMNSAPTVASSLYPQTPDAAGSGYPNAYPSSQPQGGYAGSAPNYPGSQPQGGYGGSSPAYPSSQPQGGYDLTMPAYPGSQPQGGFPGSVPSYPGSQPQGGFPGSAPSYPGNQPQGGFGAPPVMVPTQMPPKKGGNGLKIAIIILIVLIVLGGGGGAAAYFLTRPKPVISLTSQYPQNCSSPNPTGGTPTGATGTTFHITGQKFSGSSAITFLLDGQAAPGAPTVQSDANGNVTANLTVTANWQTGNHTITAKDAGDYTTQAGQSITIVTQGEAGTPGPNGAPADCASFTLHVQVQRADAVNGDQLNSFNDDLQITGQPDPAGGKVCTQDDDGQPKTSTGSDSNGNKYTETYVLQCSGSYKNGKLSYKETVTSDRIVFSDGFSCTANTPYTLQQLDGTFSSSTAASGTYSEDSTTYNCSSGTPQTFDPAKG
ncbi:MAG TPA: hypothetical protein VF099_03090, partial [Ktedonobacterales bacterium]